MNGTMMGFSRKEMDQKIDDIIEFADIGDFIHQPVKTYSSGMFARLAFAVAISIEPEILIVDEALSVGDVFFQNKCYRKFEELRAKGITVLFVSHDIGTVKQLCSRVIWIERGKQMMVGDSVEVCNAYLNSILFKRGSEYEKEVEQQKMLDGNEENKASVNEGEHQDSDVETSIVSYEGFDFGECPEISYSNESILNPDVKILTAFLTDASGVRVASCNAGETYCLSVIFSSNIEIPNCIAGFVLETVKGIWVINCNSITSGKKVPFPVGKNTYTRVDFHFDMPMIVNGDYVISAAISDGNEENFKVLTWLYSLLYVQITNVGGNGGLLKLDSEIKVRNRGQ